jgi:hypothetical protein
VARGPTGPYCKYVRPGLLSSERIMKGLTCPGSFLNTLNLARIVQIELNSHNSKRCGIIS